jgi:ElaB/YqjD/DUF883 family membrane-anchored ribosome-binding protein
MSDETEVIKDNIETIRESMASKLGAIESQVTGTLDGVRETVEQTVTSVKQSFDLKQQVNDRPWTMLGAAVLTGFVLGSLGGRDANSSPQRAASYKTDSPDTRRPVRRTASLLNIFGDEVTLIKQAALATASSLAHEALRKGGFQVSLPSDPTRTESAQQHFSEQIAPDIHVRRYDTRPDDNEVLEQLLTADTVATGAADEDAEMVDDVLTKGTFATGVADEELVEGTNVQTGSYATGQRDAPEQVRAEANLSHEQVKGSFVSEKVDKVLVEGTNEPTGSFATGQERSEEPV